MDHCCKITDLSITRIPSKVNKKSYALGVRFFCLSLYERQKSHEAGALYGTRDHALMLCAGSGVARIDDLGLSRNETLQQVDFFVVDRFEILRAEETLFGYHMSSN